MPKPEAHPYADLSSRRGLESRSLRFDEVYRCPICRHGDITGLTLMDAFACNFCRHIFTANLTEQTLQVADSSQPMAWRWNGRSWQRVYQAAADLTFVVWVVGLSIVLLPTAIVWLAVYTFPPLSGSAWAWFPMLWVGCTFLAHFILVGWLLAEQFQPPLYLATKIRVRSLFERR